MDNPQINTIEWFLGYGGNHLGLKRVLPGLRLVAACEIEGYAVANMVAKMEAGFVDAAPIWTDCKTFPCEPFRDRIDLFVASYPCQGFSAAGQRKGEEDPRYLWPWVRRAIGIIRPQYCFFENVEGHISLGLREVLTDLACLGYRVENSRGEPTWGIFSAEECGATHRRKRVFILAELADGDGPRRLQPSRALGELGRQAGDMANAESERDGQGCVPIGDGETVALVAGAISNMADPESGTRLWKTPGSGGHTPFCGEGFGHAEYNRREGRESVDGRAITTLSPSEELPTYPPGPGLGGAGVLDDIRELYGKDPQRAWGRFEAECVNTFNWGKILAIRPDLAPALSEAESALCGMADGDSNRVDRLRLCGNGVNPDTAEQAARVLFGRAGITADTENIL